MVAELTRSNGEQPQRACNSLSIFKDGRERMRACRRPPDNPTQAASASDGGRRIGTGYLPRYTWEIGRVRGVAARGKARVLSEERATRKRFPSCRRLTLRTDTCNET